MEATDNVDGDISINIIIDDTDVDINSVGDYSVTYNVSDAAGNPAIEVIRTVNIVDTTAPEIALIGANPQTIELGTTYTELGATTTDNSDTTDIVIDISDIDANSVGSYSVTYNVSDAAGNTATEVTRIVNVVDTTAPEIALIGANPQTIELGTTGYTELRATYSDKSGTITTTINDSDFVDLVGNYNIYYDATDASGNKAVQVIRIVNVVDTTKPIITLNGLKSMKINQGDDYIDAGAEVIDNDPAYSGKIITHRGKFDKNIAGSYTITYSAPADASKNNPLEKTITVVVESIVTYISISPNPTKKNIKIDNLTEDTTYVLSNAIGQILKKGIWTKTNKASIDISFFPDGIYLLNINTSKGIAVRRIIKIR